MWFKRSLVRPMPSPAEPVLHTDCPPLPTPPQMAALVEELFLEGSLSWGQLRSLGTLPELHPLLRDTIEARTQAQPE